MSNKKKQKKEKQNKKDVDESGGGIGVYAIFCSLAVIGVAYAWAILQTDLSSFALTGRTTTTSSAKTPIVDTKIELSPLQRLGFHWNSGNAVAAKAVTNGDVEDRDINRGLVATKKIPKGKVAFSADYTDLGVEISELRPELPPLVESTLQAVIKERQASFTTLTSNQILALIRFLELVDIEKEQKWTAYAETLPSNVTTMAWYWTEEERKCIVSRPDEEAIFQDLEVFRAVFAKLSEESQAVQHVYDANPRRAEWSYAMLCTRGFGDLFFVPILDMSNHNPLKSVPIFNLKDRKKFYVVSPVDIEPGEPIYSNYGPLTGIQSAERWGFVQSAYFSSPTMHLDMWKSGLTNYIPHCTKESLQFFGDVGDQLIEAQLGKGAASVNYSMYFKEYMPTTVTLACIKTIIQSEKEADVAKYVAEKLEQDYQQYAIMADADHCKSPDGNFPLIREANLVTSNLMWEAYEVARKAANDPNIPYNIDIQQGEQPNGIDSETPEKP